ncbi:MAG: methyltransferase domain-containing protein [Patescibacteria group bacterium]
MTGIIVDIGTGDGQFTNELARKNPSHLVIGIDPNQKGMEKLSWKASKKKKKGGLANALFVLADVVNLPEELNGMANQVFINLPWGSLLSGLVNVDEKVWLAIKRICQPEAVVDIILGYDDYLDLKEVKKLGLPEKFNLIYIDQEMKSRLQELGFGHMQVNNLDIDRLRSFPSSWAKKLSYGRDRKFFHVRLKVL